MEKVRCTGSMKNMVNETIERKCPKCGSMIEIWSDEEKPTVHVEKPYLKTKLLRV